MKGKFKLNHLIVHLILLVGVIVVVFPFAWMILTSFKTSGEAMKIPPTIFPEKFVTTAYHTIVTSAIPFATVYMNTIITTVVTTLVQIVFCSMAGYAFGRIEFPFKNAIFILVLSVLMVPGQIFLLPQYQIVQKLGLLDTIPALFLPNLFSAFGTFLLRQFFMSLPKELEEAAIVDGCGRFRIFAQIMLPLIKPGIVAMSIFTIKFAWNDFMWPLIVNTSMNKMTLGPALSTLQGQYTTEYPMQMAGAVPGAVALKVEEIAENPLVDKSKKLVICCSRGKYSQEVVPKLVEKGFDAVSLKGGYIAWLMDLMREDQEKDISADVEKSIRKKFRKSIWCKFTKAINQYELVKEGDCIAVCISGGKDSMLMAKLFQELKLHNKFSFDVKFLVMDPGYSPENRKVIEENARKLNVPITIYESDIFEAVFHVDQSPCYLCARMRRGHLYHYAQELGCNKIALGHHYDDVIETILMGMLYGAQVQTMMPKLHSTNFGGMELIRPMYLIREDSIKAWRDYNDLHFIQCACKFTDTCTTCNNEETKSKRMEIKQLIRTLKKTNPFIESNIFRSVENVNLDTVVGYKQYGERHYFLENYDKMGELKQEELEKKEAAQAVQESFSEQ